MDIETVPRGPIDREKDNFEVSGIDINTKWDFYKILDFFKQWYANNERLIEYFHFNFIIEKILNFLLQANN